VREKPGQICPAASLAACLAASLLGSLLGVGLGAQRARGAELHESSDEPSAFATVIDARAYDDRFSTVEELLAQTPGVSLRRFGGLGAYSTAQIRGAKAEQVLVLLDGVRLNTATRGAADLSTLPLRQVERIEVIRGGGAQRWGSDALGGVISITTRRPEDDELGADAALTAGRYGTFGGDLSVSSAGERARGLASYTRLRSDNDFEFLASAPARRGGGRPGSGSASGESVSHTRLNAGFAEDSGLLQGGVDLGPRSRLDATLDLYRKQGGEPGSTINAAVDAPDDSLSCTSGEQSNQRGVARLAFASSGAARDDYGLELAASTRLEDGQLRDPGGRCGFVSPIATGGRDFSDWREHSYALDGRLRAPSLELGPLAFAGHLASSWRFDTIDTSDSDPHRRRTLLVSLQPELGVLGETLRIFPGFAWERAGTGAGLTRRAASQGFVRVDPRDQDALLPGVGAIWQLAPGLQLKGNWKRVQRRPSLTELFHPDFSFIRGNPLLEPERGWNADLGVELAGKGAGFTRDLRFTADVFQREMRQSIEWLLSPSNTFMPQNTGPTRARGAELALGMRLASRLTLDASYTYTRARFLAEGGAAALDLGIAKLFPHVPQHAVSLAADLDLSPLRAHSELRYESETAYSVGKATTAPAALQLDAGLALRPHDLPHLRWFPRGFTLSLDGVNLTREQRFDSLGLPLPRQTLWLVRVRGATK
jgi:outer membrane receptor protein involved in Fe transport